MLKMMKIVAYTFSSLLITSNLSVAKPITDEWETIGKVYVVKISEDGHGNKNIFFNDCSITSCNNCYAKVGMYFSVLKNGKDQYKYVQIPSEIMYNKT